MFWQIFKLSFIGILIHLSIFSKRAQLLLVPCSQTGKFAEFSQEGISHIQIESKAIFLTLNNGSIVSFCCFKKISWLELWLISKVHNREDQPCKANIPIWQYSTINFMSQMDTKLFGKYISVKCTFKRS